MSDTSDRNYFDARFDGIEKIMAVQEKNLNSYISAVSINVKEIRSELQDHKESADAHGLGASEKKGASIIAWLGLTVAVLVGIASALPMLHR